MPTLGASGNPHPVELPALEIAVFSSRSVDIAPDGKSFEGVGLSPDLKLDLPPDAYGDRDPTLEKGLEVLRKRIASEDRPEADESSKAPGRSDPYRE